MIKIFSELASTLGFMHTDTGDKESSSTKSGSRTSIGSNSEAANKASGESDRIPLIDIQPGHTSKKIDQASSSPDDPSTKKTTDCSKNFFQTLISTLQKFKQL